MKPAQLSNLLRVAADRISSAKSPTKALAVSHLARALRAVDEGQPKTQTDWEQEFYGATGPYPEDQKGSGMYWDAFQELGWRDWTPASDLAEVENKLREMAQRDGWEKNLEGALKEARNNYKRYKAYEPHYTSGEVQKGPVYV